MNGARVLPERFDSELLIHLRHFVVISPNWVGYNKESLPDVIRCVKVIRRGSAHLRLRSFDWILLMMMSPYLDWNVRAQRHRSACLFRLFRRL